MKYKKVKDYSKKWMDDNKQNNEVIINTTGIDKISTYKEVNMMNSIWTNKQKEYLDGMENRLNNKIGKVEQRLNEKIDLVDKKVDNGFKKMSEDFLKVNDDILKINNNIDNMNKILIQLSKRII